MKNLQKLAKSAVSAVVPVVGSILSDAAESVLAGAGLLRGMVGTAGTLALLGVCLVPFLRLGGQVSSGGCPAVCRPRRAHCSK